MKKEFIKLSGILCAITLVAAMLLAGVNHITKLKIEEAEKKATDEAMEKILPDAKCEPVEENVFVGKKGNSIVGYCAKVTTTGYGGAIEMMVAFDMEQNISGIEILSHSETAGLGAKAADKEFKDQFKGKSSNLTVVKGEAGTTQQVSAITGATITSRAIAETGIAMAKEKVMPYFETKLDEAIGNGGGK